MHRVLIAIGLLPLLLINSCSSPQHKKVTDPLPLIDPNAPVKTELIEANRMDISDRSVLFWPPATRNKTKGRLLVKEEFIEFKSYQLKVVSTCLLDSFADPDDKFYPPVLHQELYFYKNDSIIATDLWPSRTIAVDLIHSGHVVIRENKVTDIQIYETAKGALYYISGTTSMHTPYLLDAFYSLDGKKEMQRLTTNKELKETISNYDEIAKRYELNDSATMYEYRLFPLQMKKGM
jgi:hypothetical protein